jgi:hypothetical protein
MFGVVQTSAKKLGFDLIRLIMKADEWVIGE